ncbi:MAG TPA: hypothetical protein VM534_02815 [Thermoanaerobaculia bacterium]|nr:hypothetical protein [Thermoanaerobaculia bacterium]
MAGSRLERWKAISLRLVIASLVSLPLIAGEPETKDKESEAASKPASANEEGEQTQGEGEEPASSGARSTQREPAATPAAADGPANESPLVRAARKNAGPKDKAKISIDDDDVRNSKGKMIVVSQVPLPPDEETPEPAENPAVEAQRRELAEQAEQAREERIAGVRDRIEKLETELRQLEDEYYEETEPDDLGEFVVKRFDEAQRELEEARKLLDELTSGQPSP